MLVSGSANIPPAFDKGAANCTVPENDDPSLVMTPGVLEVSMMTSVAVTVVPAASGVAVQQPVVTVQPAPVLVMQLAPLLRVLRPTPLFLMSLLAQKKMPVLSLLQKTIKANDTALS